MKKIVIIMAGGSGERFWPLSKTIKPKQLLDLSGNSKTLLEESIDRIINFVDNKDIYIITNSILQNKIRDILKTIPPENVIAEPYKRNTAPCLALAAGIILAKYCNYNPNEIVISVLTADQIIEPVDKFLYSLNILSNFSLKSDSISTIGIVPNRPETGFGYIELANVIDENNQMFKAKKFHEKPDKETALKYIHSGNCLWNSGMFFFRLDIFIDLLTNHLPEIGSQIKNISILYKDYINCKIDGALPQIDEIYKNFPDISIDYGLMEKLTNVYVLKSNFSWDDIGSWDALFRIRNKDINGNIIEGEVEYIDVTNSIIINHSTNKFLIAGFRLDEMLIVKTDDALLVTKLSNAQEIKQIIKQLKENNKLDWI